MDVLFCTNISWVGHLLTSQPNVNLSNPSPKYARYSIKIRRDANLPRRSYAIEWRQVTAAEASLYQDLATNDTVCYWYSENDWYGSDSTFGQSHTQIQNNLSGLNDQRVIHCDTGQALVLAPPPPTP